MSLALRIAIGWSIAIVVTIALWNLGFILAARRQRALDAEGVPAGGDGGAVPDAPRGARAAAGRTPAARASGRRPAVLPRRGRHARAG